MPSQDSHDTVPALRIGLRALLFAAAVLLVLMTATGIITTIMPSGEFQRELVDGSEQLVEGSFVYTSAAAPPFWHWYTAPVEVLWGPDSIMIISISLFMLCIAGAITVMQSGGVLTYLIERITVRFSGRRYMMEALIVLVFMLFGSILGSMEEIVVLVPLVTALAVRMGWDRLTGLGLSLGAIAFGFAAAISNPFTIGVAQGIAGLPLFSGICLRVIIFITVYCCYTAYIIRQSRATTRQRQLPSSSSNHLQEQSPSTASPRKESRLQGSSIWFGGVMALMLATIFIATFLEGLGDIILVLVVVFFLVGGIGSGAIAGMRSRVLVKAFLQGVLGVAPGIILVLMAASVKHIMVSASIMDTILYRASERIAEAGPYSAVLMLFSLVLLLNFFISSGSAKAFLIMPIAAPLADMVGLTRQSAVLAYMFGDGFSNILYPTNALLLICLAITGVSYGAWFRWIWRIELVLLLISIAFLLLAVAAGY